MHAQQQSLQREEDKIAFRIEQVVLLCWRCNGFCVNLAYIVSTVAAIEHPEYVQVQISAPYFEQRQ